MKLTGENRSTRGKTCPSATFSTTNPTCTDPGSNPGLRGEKPATNRLRHGTALGTSVPKETNVVMNQNTVLRVVVHTIQIPLHTIHVHFSHFTTYTRKATRFGSHTIDTCTIQLVTTLASLIMARQYRNT
jgi:hypothetical protein